MPLSTPFRRCIPLELIPKTPTADEAPPATSAIIEVDSPLQPVQGDPLAAPEATLQPSPPTAAVTVAGSAIEAAADLETPAETASMGEPDAGPRDASVTASAANGELLTESESSAAPDAGPTAQPESGLPSRPEPPFASAPEFTSSTDTAMQPTSKSDTTPGFRPAGVPDDADTTSPAETSERSDHQLPASWPSEASIDAATTGRGVDSGVSRETIEAPLDPPVSRETGTEHGGTPLADQIADETRRRLALDEAVLPLPPSTRILTISNQKGGVGKTTTAVNLAAALARTGAHVLVIDLDPQGNASTALGVDHRSEQQSVYEVLVSDLALSEVIRPSTEHEHLDCVPATIHLAGAEIELVSLVAREQRLRRALDNHLATMERPYDYVFIDCPPSLGLLTINAFVAAREVLIPIQCEYYALEGLSQLLSNIELIEKHLNPELRLSTILLTMYDSRTNLAQQVAQEVRDHFPRQTLHTIIPRSVRVSEAPSYGQSVISYDFASTGVVVVPRGGRRDRSPLRFEPEGNHRWQLSEPDSDVASAP